MLEESESQSSSSDPLQAFERYARERDRQKVEVQQLIERNRALFQNEPEAENENSEERSESVSEQEAAPGDEFVDDFYNGHDVEQPGIQVVSDANPLADQMVLYPVTMPDAETNQEIDRFIAEKTQVLEQDLILEQTSRAQQSALAESQHAADQQNGVLDMPADASKQKKFISQSEILNLKLQCAKRRQFRVNATVKREVENFNVLAGRLARLSKRQAQSSASRAQIADAIQQREDDFMRRWGAQQPRYLDAASFGNLRHRFLCFQGLPAIQTPESDAVISATLVPRGNELIYKLSGGDLKLSAASNVLQLVLEDISFPDGQFDCSPIRSLVSVQISKTNLKCLKAAHSILVELNLADNALENAAVDCAALNYLRLTGNRLRCLELAAPALQFLFLDYNPNFSQTIAINQFYFLQQFSAQEARCRVEFDGEMLYLEQLILAEAVPVALSDFNQAFMPSLKRLEAHLDESQHPSHFVEALCALNTVFPRIQNLCFSNRIAPLSEAGRSMLAASFPGMQLFQRAELAHASEDDAGRFANAFVWALARKQRLIDFPAYPGRLFNYQCEDTDFSQFQRLLAFLNCSAGRRQPNLEPYLRFKRLYFAFLGKNESAVLAARQNDVVKQRIAPQLLTALARLRALYGRRFCFACHALQPSPVFHARLESRAAVRIQRFYKRSCASAFLGHVFHRATARAKQAAWWACLSQNLIKIELRVVLQRQVGQLHSERAEEACKARKQRVTELHSIITANSAAFERADALAEQLFALKTQIRSIFGTVRAARAIICGLRARAFRIRLSDELAAARRRLDVFASIQHSHGRAVLLESFCALLRTFKHIMAQKRQESQLAQLRRTLDEFSFGEPDYGQAFDEPADFADSDGASGLPASSELIELPALPAVQLRQFLDSALQEASLSASSAVGQLDNSQKGHLNAAKRPQTPPVLGPLSDKTKDASIVSARLPELLEQPERSRALREAELQGWHFDSAEAADAWYRAQKRLKNEKKEALSASEKYKRLVEKRRK